jgi:hypothetical protein
MKIQSESLIAHPREKVFEVYRDRLDHVASFLADVREIKVISREEADGQVTIHNEWISDAEIPKMARSMLKPEHLRWDDFATWHEASYVCDWTIKTRVFTDAIDCKGRTELIDEGGRTRVRLRGEFRIGSIDIPGVPRFMAKRMVPQIEKFIVAMITPNLEKTNTAVGHYLDAQG